MIFKRVLILSFLFFGSLHAEKKIPYLSGPVIDDVGLLNSSEKMQLENYIRSQEAVLQMQVWITSLEGESVEGLAHRAASTWNLGTEKRDNGLLLLVAPQERRMRFEVGRGLEGDIPDILAGRILDYTARPNFREGQFLTGIRASLEQAAALAAKGPDADKIRQEYASAQGRGRSSNLFFWILFILFFALPLLRIFFPIFGFGRRSRYSSWGTGGTYWGGGSGGSSWGGGSGWSGGGGSFGGGGSSSSW